MKKILSLTLAALLSIGLLSGCTKKTEENKNIRFGILPAESAIPIIVAKEKGFFEKEGINVDITTFTSPNDRNIAVQANKLDGIIADTMTALSLNEGGFKMKITSDINEDFKLLTSPKSGIDSFEKLNNKKVSIVPNFVLEYIMDEMAKKNNIKYETVVIPSFQARFEALLSNKIDGVIFTEPQATLLASQGAKVLATSKEYKLKAGTILFNNDVLSKQPNTVKNFYKAYNEAVEYINKTDAKEYGSVLTKYTFPDAIVPYLSANGKTYEKAQEISSETFKNVLEWTKSKNMIKKDYKFEDVSDFKFIK
ncbi:ABC transporter substrate-binding protein [Clostridium sp. YIM B02515]|uniref:ABC transporter substrate-binding protein n=1 Tax=Clostridium rhizosphaerae TaxID=2803861 RepID=A0ABS1T5M0_9CLOT|nr:ABC transporter substrate-binding protein [Clostridium rhizosphaerae]MBL4934422.1 ABC transporter substrate-binding protein [Clostridium rhizosphaerae]